MLKPLRSKILVARFPLDAPLGRRPRGGGGAFAFCPKNNGCLVPQNNTNCPANMLTLIVCPFKNVGNTCACMLFTAYLHQKANGIIIPLRINKLENWHTLSLPTNAAPQLVHLAVQPNPYHHVPHLTTNSMAFIHLW